MNNRKQVSEAFGRVLREARDAAGLTQEVFARRCKIDRTYPSLLERGLRCPSLNIVFTIADVLNTSPQKLIKSTKTTLRERNREHE